jgi:hypothetical protein
VITSVIFFVTGEILTRLFKKESPRRVVASENQKLVYELNKNYAEINSFGMRDEEFDIDSIRDLYKIAVVGDSHTYATRVKSRTETFPSQLEKYLNQNMTL